MRCHEVAWPILVSNDCGRRSRLPRSDCGGSVVGPNQPGLPVTAAVCCGVGVIALDCRRVTGQARSVSLFHIYCCQIVDVGRRRMRNQAWMMADPRLQLIAAAPSALRMEISCCSEQQSRDDDAPLG